MSGGDRGDVEHTHRQPTASHGTFDPDDVRAGYSAAVQLAVYDGQLSWQVTGIYVQFAFIMIAGAIFPSFVGTEDNKVLALAGLAVSLAGVITTAMFGSMVSRIRTYESYWVLQAAALEDLLDQAVSTITGSFTLSSEGTILVGDERIRMRPEASVKSRHMLTALIIAFLLAFLGVLALNAWRLVRAF